MELKTRREYSNLANKERALKDTNLREVRIVRYADDFKLFVEIEVQRKRCSN
ncbi:hypothetical protein NON08_13150 [Cetobacterium somerae]|uniref:hypothetical protein n=1 Tax=Cetobacterium sp. NK01 TaxID=2993530 RepID=UPI002115F659|nr:hypothetical protein [Cetobacterium sp. NK01]MCQ8213447.1 hypothetical protein [Cetobacterium sp. NK01]